MVQNNVSVDVEEISRRFCKLAALMECKNRSRFCVIAVDLTLSERNTLLVSLASDLHIFQKQRQLFQQQRLGPVYKCLTRCGMKIHQNHVRPDDDALRGHMHEVKNPFRSGTPRSNCVRRIDANRHARQGLHYRDVSEIDEVPMWVGEVRLNTPESEDYFSVSFGGQIFSGVQRLT